MSDLGRIMNCIEFLGGEVSSTPIQESPFYEHCLIACGRDMPNPTTSPTPSGGPGSSPGNGGGGEDWCNGDGDKPFGGSGDGTDEPEVQDGGVNAGGGIVDTGGGSSGTCRTATSLSHVLSNAGPRPETGDPAPDPRLWATQDAFDAVAASANIIRQEEKAGMFTAGSGGVIDGATGGLSFHVAMPPGRATDTRTMLQYNSLAAASSSVYGKRWKSNFDRVVNDIDASSADLITGADFTHHYTGLTGPTGTYDTPPTTTNRLDKGASWTETQLSGFKLHYDSGGTLDRLQNDSGYLWTITREPTTQRVSHVTDPLNLRTTFSYDGNGKLSSIEDCHGREMQFTVASDLLTSIVNPALCQTQFEYDGNDRIRTRIDPDGKRITFSYDASGRVTSVEFPDINPTTYTYQANNVTEFMDPRGCVTTLAYDTNRSLQHVVDPLGCRATYTWVNDKLESFQNPMGDVTTFAYTTGPGDVTLLKSVCKPLGGMTTLHHDSSGRVVSIEDPNSCRTTISWAGTTHQIDTVMNPLGQCTTYTRNSMGQITEREDAMGYVTSFVYDSSGLRTKQVLANGSTTTYTYNEYGRLETATNPLGYVTTQIRDEMNRLTVLINPLGQRTSYTYGTGCRLDAVENALGYRTSYVYDAANRLHAVVNPLNERTTYAYDEGGNRISVTNALGRISTSVYDETARKKATVNALGRITTHIYDVAGLYSSTVDALGNYSTTLYDPNGRVVANIDPLDRRTTFTYNARGQRTKVTNPLGESITFAYDGVGRRIQSFNPLGRLKQSIYDEDGRLIAQINPLGQRSTLSYDPAGWRTGRQNPLGNSDLTVYDEAGRVLRTVDPLGYLRTFTYDATGRLVSTIDPLGKRTTTVYDAAGQTTVEINPLGYRTTYTHNQAGRRYRMQDPAGFIWTFTHDKIGQLQSTTDPLGNRTTTVYDQIGQPFARDDALGNRWTTTYDKIRQIQAQINPLGERTTHAYDAAGQKFATINPLGQRTTFNYDAAGRQVSVQDANGHFITVIHDAAGQPSAAQSALGYLTTNTYDDAGRRTKLTDALGHVHTFVYDAAGQLTRQEDPLGRSHRYTYDVASQLREVNDGRGWLLTHTFDSAGREKNRYYRDHRRITFTYDAVGKRTEMRDWNGFHGYDYDARGNLTAVRRPPWQYPVTSTYDAAGRRIRVETVKSGNIITYAYDALGQVTQANGTTISYDAAGRRAALVHANGTHSTYTYDVAGRLSMLEHFDKNQGFIRRYQYAYDGVGNKLHEEEMTVSGAPTTVTYEYDNSYQLTVEHRLQGSSTLEITTHAYDAVGNRLTEHSTDPVTTQLTTFAYDVANQLLTQDISNTGTGSESRSYTYDGNGNIEWEYRDGVLKFKHWFDPENRMYHVNDQGFGQDYTYEYNADNQRIRAIDSQGTRRFFWDGANILVETKDTGGILRFYVTDGDRYGRLLYMKETNPPWYTSDVFHYYHFDALGSTRVLTAEDGSTQSDQYAYTAFGTYYSGSGSPTNNPFRWIGELGYYHDTDRGGHHVRARFYSPSLARFLGIDPAGFPDGPNRYLYVRNKSINAVDPSGSKLTRNQIVWNSRLAAALEPHRGYAYHNYFGFQRFIQRLIDDVTPHVTIDVSSTGPEAFATYWPFYDTIVVNNLRQLPGHTAVHESVHGLNDFYYQYFWDGITEASIREDEAMAHAAQALFKAPNTGKLRTFFDMINANNPRATCSALEAKWYDMWDPDWNPHTKTSIPEVLFDEDIKWETYWDYYLETPEFGKLTNADFLKLRNDYGVFISCSAALSHVQFTHPHCCFRCPENLPSAFE